MERITNIFRTLDEVLKKELINFFDNIQSHYLEVFKQQNINLNQIIESNEKYLEDPILEKIVNLINSFLLEIKVSSDEIKTFKQVIYDYIIKYDLHFSNYNTIFEFLRKRYVNVIILKLILDYLFNLDEKLINNSHIRELLPENFLEKLNQIRGNLNIEKSELKFINNNNIDLNFLIEEFCSNLEEKKEVKDLDILARLRQAREANLEIIDNISSNGMEKINNDLTKIEDIKIKSTTVVIESPKRLYFEHFGDLPTINNNSIPRLNINLKNILEFDFIENIKLFDLENLYYYVNIQKILGNIQSISKEGIINFLRNYINGTVFSTSRFHVPNPISNVHGLSIISELNMTNMVDFIDLLDIEMFFEDELEHFVLEKLFLNLHSLLGLMYLKKIGCEISDKSHLITPLKKINILNLEKRNLPLDILCQLTSIKLLDKEHDLTVFKKPYIHILKREMRPNCLVNDCLMDSIRTLIIFDLLELKIEESQVISDLLTRIFKNAHLFFDFKPTDTFSWRNDQLALKIELRTFFWYLILMLQFSEYF